LQRLVKHRHELAHTAFGFAVRSGDETWNGTGLSNWSWNGVAAAAASVDASSIRSSAMLG
jgi:hypothetical protein